MPLDKVPVQVLFRLPVNKIYVMEEVELGFAATAGPGSSLTAVKFSTPEKLLVVILVSTPAASGFQNNPLLPVFLYRLPKPAPGFAGAVTSVS